MLKILFFGQLSDLSDRLEIPVPNGVRDSRDLARWLGRENTALGEALQGTGIQVALNGVIVDAGIEKGVPLVAGDEVAYLSPLSGG